MKVLVAVILGLFLSHADAYTVAETCAIVQTNTFIADPEDCSGYYYCVDGAVSFRDTCGKGYVYNAHTGSCDYPSNYQCPFNGQICQGLSLVYLPDPLSCSSYIYCDAKGNAAYGTCPPDQIYNGDDDSPSCVYSDSLTSCSGQKCALVPNNRFVAGDDKYTSYTCWNGIGIKNECNSDGGTTFQYNPIKGECELAPIESEDPVALCATLTAAENFVASTIDCNAYYYCAPVPAGSVPNTPRKATKLFCPQRFHFNQINQNCDYSWNLKPAATNRCNRCGGYPAGSFVGTSNNCQGYEYCTGKIETKNDVASCPSTYPFFNEKDQNCVKNDPKLTYCAA